MAVYKVEICGVNTSKLPLLTEKEKKELFDRIRKGDKEAREKVEMLMEQMVEQWGVTEELKMHEQMEWVRRKDNIQAIAEEIALKEIIYL